MGRTQKPIRTSVIAQRNLVGFGDVVGFDRPQTLAKALAGLAQELQRVRRGVPRGRALRISLVLLDQVRLKSRSDFVNGLECLLYSSVPRNVLNHAASI
jgi:hypothetical protein